MWPKTVCKVVIIDGQGGRIGRELVEAVDKNEDRVEVIAIGTNSTATANMLKGGAHQAATGENAVLVACRTADIIAGPIGMLAADALLGEITPAMAAAVGQSTARKILLPVNRCEMVVAGVAEKNTGNLIAHAVKLIEEAVAAYFDLAGACR